MDISEFYKGIITCESFTTLVVDSDDNDYYVDEIDGSIGYDIRVKAWKEYLSDWFTNHAALIEKVLAFYDAEELGAWGFGIDVAYCVLRTGISFDDHPFLDALLADELDDSLQDEKTDDGVNEFWFENGQLHVG